MTIGASIDCPKYESSFYNQTTSHASIIVPLYFASMLDSAIVGCFLLFQLTTPFPKENMKPLVDLLFGSKFFKVYQNLVTSSPFFVFFYLIFFYHVKTHEDRKPNDMGLQLSALKVENWEPNAFGFQFLASKVGSQELISRVIAY